MKTDLKAMPPSPGSEETFKRLREESKDCIRSLRLLDCDWPDAIDVIKDLCSLISDAICTESGKPILFHAVHRGLNEYSANILADDYRRLNIFLNAVLDELGEQLESLVVLNTDRNTTWRPDDCEPFLLWWDNARVESITLVHGKCPKSCIVERLRDTVLTPKQIEHMEVA